MRSSRSLGLIVPLLLLGLFLRIHHLDRLPVFIDEYRHLTRGVTLWHLRQNPVEYGHGKLLLYVWLGFFNPTISPGGLLLARMAIALVALVNGAVVLATARLLFGTRAGVVALVFYLFAPFTVFYERMALADPLAGALAALVAWQSLRLARRPTRRRGALVGALVSLTSLAKLTTALIAGLPLIALLLFPALTLPPGIKNKLRALWTCYRKALIAAALTMSIFGGVYAAGVVISLLSGGTPVIIDPAIARYSRANSSILAKTKQTWEIVRLFLSVPVGVLLIGLALRLCRKSSVGYVLAWGGLIALPLIAASSPPRARYLMAAGPALAVLFSAGVLLSQRRWITLVYGAVSGGLLIGFVLPFMFTTWTDPSALDLPYTDRQNYFGSDANGWGARSAMEYLDRYGDPIPAVGVLNYCPMVSLYRPASLDWTCTDTEKWTEEARLDVTQWAAVAQALHDHPAVVVLTTHLTPGIPPTDLGRVWTLLFEYPTRVAG